MVPVVVQTLQHKTAWCLIKVARGFVSFGVRLHIGIKAGERELRRCERRPNGHAALGWIKRGKNFDSLLA